MAKRKLEYAPEFQKNLKTLEKKYRGLGSIVGAFLNGCAENGPPPTSKRIPNLKGEAVYKDRIALPGGGKRAGARIVYYCDSSLVYALYLYAKNDRGDMPVSEIESALSVLP